MRGQKHTNPALKNSANLGRRGIPILAVCLVALLTACDATGGPPQPSVDPRSLLVLGLFVVLVLLGWVSGNRWERRRRQAVSAVGAQMGFAFEPKGILRPECRELRFFRKHAWRKVRNVLRARRSDSEVLFLDYECGEDGAGSVLQTIAAFRVDGRALASFEVHPESFLNRLPARAASALNRKLVWFDSPYPDFARHYLVEASRGNHIAVRQLFPREVQSSFSKLDTDHEWSIEGAGEWLVLYRFNWLPKPEAYVEFVHKATAIAEALRVAGFGRSLR